MAHIADYKLSEDAEADISAIYDYTATLYGRDKAITYLTGLERSLDSLVEHPEIGRQRLEIRQGLRSFVYEHHIIFYRLHDDYIRVVRVLHESCDMPQFLK